MTSRKHERFIRVPDWFAEPTRRFTTFSSVVQKNFDSIALAQIDVEVLKVRVDFGGRLTIANLAYEFLMQLTERDVILPQALIVDADAFREYNQSQARFIAAKTVGKIIFINPSSVVWENPLQIAAQMYAGRFWSTPHPLHPFFHEEGHILLGTAGQIRSLNAKETTTAASVSTYAKGNQEELVCEMFAGLFSGVEYDADMVRVYKRLGGTMP